MVIPSGVDMDLFRPIPRCEARRLLGWRDEERVVLFNAAGRTPGVKRLDLAEASVAVMRQLIGEVRFVVLRGDIDQEEVPLYLSGADCLLLTSDYEGSPDIIKEALACGLPVVSVEVGDVPERLEGVYPSRIVARDPRAVGTAAAEIVLSGQRSNGRELIRELSSTSITEKILQVYRSMINESCHGGDDPLADAQRRR
jgi:glycosyltransferase involved in cell wall biosynthesis